MRFPALLLVVLALFLSVGCAQDKLRIGGKNAPKLYKSAVSLSPGSTEVFFMFARRSKLLGRTASCDKPKPVLELPIVMKGVKPDYEMIQKLAPDVVVYDADLFGENDLQKFKELQIDTLAISGRTVDEFIESLYTLGKYTGSETGISDYADRIYGARRTAQSVMTGLPPVKVAVLLPGPGGRDMIAGAKSFVADIVRASGGVPVGPDATSFVPLNPESFVTQNPDFILVGVGPGDSTDTILKDPRFASINAVKKKNVQGLLQDVVVRKGSQVNQFIDNLNALIAKANK